MNFSKFILCAVFTSTFILGACSDTTETIAMAEDSVADEEGLEDDDSKDAKSEGKVLSSSSSKSKSSSSKAKSSSSVKEESKDVKSSASTKDDDSTGDKAKSSASTKDDDSVRDEAKSSSSSIKKRIPGMDDDSADEAKSSSSVKVVVSSSSVTVKLSSSSAVVVSSDSKDDGKDDVVPSSDSKPADVSSSSVEGYGDGSETVIVNDTTSIGTDQMDTVGSSESSYLDSLKQELEDETTEDPENFDILDSGNIDFDDIDTNNVYFCFTGDDEWLRINFEDMYKSNLPFIRNGHAWGLRKKYLVRFEEACEAVYVMRKER